jgi:PPM family protein phosphatase
MSEKKINISLHAQTDIGMVRHGNEDNFLVADLSTADIWTVENLNSPPKRLSTFSQGRHGLVLAVSDGMGGALAGEVASQMAVSAVRNRMVQFQGTPHFARFAFSERLRLAIEQANQLINHESQNNVEYTGMGATFTAAGLEGDIAYLAQVGDSRCYLVRQGKIYQITKDQSLVSQLVESGHITEEEAESHTYKNVILQALGAQPRVNVIIDRLRLRRNDVLLLCSDGLSGKIRGPEMLRLINESNDIKSACEAMIHLANERGGEDNITVLVAHFAGEGLEEVRNDDPIKGEFLPREESLPYEIDPNDLMGLEEETLRPEELEERERVDVVETQEVQATMLNIQAITPEMLAQFQSTEPVATAATAVAEVPLAAAAATATAATTTATPRNGSNATDSIDPDLPLDTEVTPAPTQSGNGLWALMFIFFLILLGLAALLYFRPGIIPFLQSAIGLVI